MKRYKHFILMVGLAMAFSLARSNSSVFAADTERESLRGLNGVYIFIDDLSPNLERAGLSKNQIQTDVELKLRLAGIKVLTREEWKKEKGVPYISVVIDASPQRQKEPFPVFIMVRLQQGVRLYRNSLLMHTATWEVLSNGVLSKENIRAGVKDLVDKFINDYLSVNPKK